MTPEILIKRFEKCFCGHYLETEDGWYFDCPEEDSHENNALILWHDEENKIYTSFCVYIGNYQFMFDLIDYTTTLYNNYFVDSKPIIKFNKLLDLENDLTSIKNQIDIIVNFS